MTALASRLERAYLLYRKRLARCRTENQRNRLQIVLGNYMTPLEVRYFDDMLSRDSAEAQSRAWIAGFRRMLPTRKVRPVEFERKGILKGMSYYTAETGSAEQKTLLVGFAGHFHSLGLQTALFLDCLSPALYDVILLRDYSRRFFALGIPGLGRDFFEAVSNLRRHVDPDAYRNGIALGSSAGGLPAVLAAILLGSLRGIWLGGMDFPQFADKLRGEGVAEAPYAALLASRPVERPEILLVYSASHAVDAAAARSLHDRVPSQLLEVKRCPDHGVLPWKLARGELPSFLSEILGQEVEDRPAQRAALGRKLAS